MAHSMTLAEKGLVEPGREKEESLAAQLPFITAIDDKTIMLRDGDLMVAFAVDGISAATADGHVVDDLADLMSSLVSQQYGDVGFYIHRVSNKTKPSLDPVTGNNDFAAAIDQRWQNYIGNAGLRHRTSVVTLTLRPNKVAGFWAKLSGGGSQAKGAQMQRRLTRINEIAQSFIESMALAKPRRMTVSGGEWLGLLRAITTGVFSPIRPGRAFTPINDLIATTSIGFYQDSFTVFGNHASEMKFGTILTLKDYPGTTYAGILDGLDLACDMTITNSFTPVDPVTAQAHMQRVIRQMNVADDAAVSLKLQLTEALDDVASGRVSFGLHHATIALFPEEATKPHGWAHKNTVVQFVEVPFIEQELVKARMLTCQFFRR